MPDAAIPEKRRIRDMADAEFVCATDGMITRHFWPTWVKHPHASKSTESITTGTTNQTTVAGPAYRSRLETSPPQNSSRATRIASVILPQTASAPPRSRAICRFHPQAFPTSGVGNNGCQHGSGEPPRRRHERPGARAARFTVRAGASRGPGRGGPGGSSPGPPARRSVRRARAAGAASRTRAAPNPRARCAVRYR